MVRFLQLLGIKVCCMRDCRSLNRKAGHREWIVQSPWLMGDNATKFVPLGRIVRCSCQTLPKPSVSKFTS